MQSVDAEKKLQGRVLKWLTKDLGYEYIGNLEETDNLPIIPELLTKNLKKRGYADAVIKKAVDELVLKTKNQVDKLYKVNMDVYSALRYGRQGVKDAKGKTPSPFTISTGRIWATMISAWRKRLPSCDVTARPASVPMWCYM